MCGITGTHSCRVTLLIESVDVLRGAAGGVGPGSAGQAERPSSHSLPQCLGEQGGSLTSGRGVAQSGDLRLVLTWAHLSPTGAELHHPTHPSGLRGWPLVAGEGQLKAKGLKEGR